MKHYNIALMFALCAVALGNCASRDLPRFELSYAAQMCFQQWGDRSHATMRIQRFKDNTSLVLITEGDGDVFKVVALDLLGTVLFTAEKRENSLTVERLLPTFENNEILELLHVAASIDPSSGPVLSTCSEECLSSAESLSCTRQDEGRFYIAGSGLQSSYGIEVAAESPK